AASSGSILAGRFWATIAQTSTGFLQALVSIAIIAWGVYLVRDGETSTGALVAATMLAGRVLAPLGSISATLARLEQTVHSFRTIDAIMRMDVERPAGHAFVNRRIESGSIEFKAVTFRYPGAADEALRDVSFRIEGGERVGIVGRVGSGKTTVGRLLVNLHQPQSGTILVDGIDSRQYDPADLREGVGFVSQDNVLFTGTVRENIAIGRPQAEDEEVIEAARIAGVEDFVARHPHGYDLAVGEGGRALSGGQRQSIALARALLKRPRIYFLDEPTSNLDSTAEQRLIARLREFSEDGATVLISTHRMSVLDLVDRVIVLDDGRVALDGPKAEVFRKLRELGAGVAVPLHQVKTT
ncbi:MAG TPA: ATP-binding cassette domain-containing protein, partial [Kaistiaceae bacterium]|nr:ATP-binding cassette domain-containing protein [Kaistiaceae bacterium]